MEIAREKTMVLTLWIRVLSSCNDYLEISADTWTLLRITMSWAVFRRDLQGIFLGMKVIPTRDESAFTMGRNLIIGSMFYKYKEGQKYRKLAICIVPL